MTLSINNNLTLCWVSRFIYGYAECLYAECRYAEGRGAQKLAYFVEELIVKMFYFIDNTIFSL